MKKIKELKLEELSLKQKIGMTMVGCLTMYNENHDNFDDETEYVLSLIKEHCLGAVFLDVRLKRRDEIMAKIKEAADYPILIITDAESGIEEFQIGKHNAIGVAGKKELAYTFGKVVGVTARNLGYNVVEDPIMEIQRGPGVCGKNSRAIGSDKDQVAMLAAKIVEGMHDGGILSFAKHYPSSNNTYNIDSHMAEAYSEDDLNTVLNLNLYPYFELMRQNLLDGIMTQHFKLASVDPEHPASLSKKVINLIRDRGFDGIAITDAMCMMGIVAKYGKDRVKGLAVEAGNDLMLPWFDNKDSFEALCKCYDDGIISDETLNNAARRVLEAQHKTLIVPKYTKLTREDIENFKKINTDSVYEYVDDGILNKLSSDGKHLFAVMVPCNTDIAGDGSVSVDTFKSNWYFPEKITEKLNKLFPNSTVRIISEFPTANRIEDLLNDSVEHDDVIFFTYAETAAYTGKECLTSRIISLIEALQVTKRVSTLVHFGNPYVLEELAHIPRVIIGCLSAENVSAAIDVLAGLYPAKGVATYDAKLK